MRPEEKIEKAFCKKLMEKYRIEAYKFDVRKGSPDRIILLPNAITLFIEFKRPDGVTSWHQDEFIYMLKSRDHKVYIESSVESAMNLVESYME